MKRWHFLVLGGALALGLLLSWTAWAQNGRAAGVEIASGSTGAPQTEPVSITGPTTPTVQHLYHVYFPRSYYDYNATLYLQNPNTLTVNLVLSFYDSAGGLAASVADAIPPWGEMVVAADGVFGLADGNAYSLIVSADLPVESVVHVHRSTPSGDRLAAYRGAGSASAQQYFGPYFYSEGGVLAASLLVWNVNDVDAHIAADFYDLNGSLATSALQTVPPYGQYTFFNPAGLPVAFAGSVRITADQPVVGLLFRDNQIKNEFAFDGWLGTGAVQSYAPRALKAFDEGGGPRTTTLFVGNTGVVSTDVTLDYHAADGAVGHSSDFVLLPAGAKLIPLSAEGGLPDHSPWAVALAGNEPLLIGGYTEYDGAFTHSSAAYAADADVVLNLPRMARTSTAYTVFTLQNTATSTATVSIAYHDLTGAQVFTETTMLSANGWVWIDLRPMAALSSHFQGSAHVTSDRPLIAQVVEYQSEVADTGEVHVCPSGCEFWSVQAAADAVDAGGVVKVAAGVYTALETRPSPTGYSGAPAVTQVAYITKDLTLEGGYTSDNWTTPDPEANPTTLDAQGQGRVIFIAGGVAPIIKGLRITGGDATGLGGVPWGMDTGGGLYAIGSHVVIENSRVFSNTGSTLGAGLVVFSGTAAIKNNVITGNSAEWVGGVYLYECDATVSDNVVSYNTASQRGGGLLSAGGNVTYERNVITHNSASEGGGLALEDSDATLMNNVLADNAASSSGSALFVWGSAPYLKHNTIARNTGGDGSGIYITTDAWNGVTSTVELFNTILVSHAVGLEVTAGNAAFFDHALFFGNGVNTTGAGSVGMINGFSGDPAFAADGYHLTADSEARDKGIDAGISADIDLDMRPIGAGYDLGADELPPLPATATADGGTLVYSDVGGGQTTLQVPPGAVLNDTIVILTPKAAEAVEELPAGLAFGGRVFELEAYQNGTLVLGFARAVTLTVEYTDADVVDVFEDTLKPYRWTAGGWALIGTQFGEEGYTLDAGNNRMTFYLLGFSRFGHFAVGINARLYLPLLLK